MWNFLEWIGWGGVNAVVPSAPTAVANANADSPGGRPPAESSGQAPLRGTTSAAAAGEEGIDEVGTRLDSKDTTRVPIDEQHAQSKRASEISCAKDMTEASLSGDWVLVDNDMDDNEAAGLDGSLELSGVKPPPVPEEDVGSTGEVLANDNDSELQPVQDKKELDFGGEVDRDGKVAASDFVTPQEEVFDDDVMSLEDEGGDRGFYDGDDYDSDSDYDYHDYDPDEEWKKLKPEDLAERLERYNAIYRIPAEAKILAKQGERDDALWSMPWPNGRGVSRRAQEQGEAKGGGEVNE